MKVFNIQTTEIFIKGSEDTPDWILNASNYNKVNQVVKDGEAFGRSYNLDNISYSLYRIDSENLKGYGDYNKLMKLVRLTNS